MFFVGKVLMLITAYCVIWFAAGEDGSGPLFFQFLRVLLHFKQAALLSNREDFFLLFENTSNLDVETCSSISK
jgi:hypothetical protein